MSAMSNDFSELILTCTTNEWNKNRVAVISAYFELHGAAVQNKHLKHCDYHIEGLYKSVPVNLGIENKVLTGDFYKSLNDMPEKFLEAYQVYDDVALVVEEGNYTIKMTDDNYDCWVQEPTMQSITGAEGVGLLSMYQNFCDSMSEAGIHVRSYRTVNHLPVTVSGLLKHIVKPIHRGITMKNPNKYFYTDMLNIMVRLPGVGVKTAEKGLQYIPNLERFNNMSLSDLRDIFGKAQGGKLYSFITNRSRVKECSAAWEELYVKNAPGRRKDITKQIKENRDTKVQKAEENAPKRILDRYIETEYVDVTDESKKYYQVLLDLVKTKENGITQTDIISMNPGCPEVVVFNLIREYLKEGLCYEKNGFIILTEPAKDVVEFIRQMPRTLDDVQKYFGFSSECAFTTLMAKQGEGKIWYQVSNKTWNFGKPQEPMYMVADKEMDIGVY